jgi:WD40 repeat protein
MSRMNRQWSGIACAVALAAAGASALIALPPESRRSAVPPRFDRAGDPLPDRAIARLGVSRFRHTATVGQIVYSADGKIVFSSSPGEDGVQVWDAASGRPIRRIGSNRIYSLALSPDGTRIVTGEVSEKLRVLDVATGNEIGLIAGHTQTDRLGRIREDLDSAHFVAFAGNNDRILAEQGAERAVIVWDLPTQKAVVRIANENEGMFTSLTVSRDGRSLLSGSSNGEITVWNLADGKLVRKLRDRKSVV